MGITLESVNYTYQTGTPFEGRALFDINLSIKEDFYIAFIGHAGSGESTIMQLLDGLNVPIEGTVIVDDIKITTDFKNKNTKPVRKEIGLVLQFPESQLFEKTVLKDIAFGPRNFGVSIEEAEQLAREKPAMVSISEEFLEKNPFKLSSGQMRCIAIAGILAIEPEVLILDEPTVGLDPRGHHKLMDLFKKLRQNGMTIVLVTHLVDDMANYAGYVNVLEGGKLIRSGCPREVFRDVGFPENKQLGVPKIVKFAQQLVERGLQLESLSITVEEFTEVVKHR